MKEKINPKRLCEFAIIDFFSMIQTVMKKKGITKTELSEMMGCAPANLTQIFRKKDLRLSTMFNVAAALDHDIKFEYIVERQTIKILIEHRLSHVGKPSVVMYLGDGETNESD